MDIMHLIGSDLSVAATGDIATSAGSEAVRQRVLRRLLTNPGGYVWHLSYGGGLPGFVGGVVNASGIETTIRQQMMLENAVLRTPLPTVDTQAVPGGTFIANVTYSDNQTGTPQVATLPLGT